MEVELAAISPLTIQAFNKDTFTVRSFKKLLENPKGCPKVNYMNFTQEKLIGSNEFDLGTLGGCTEKPVEVELAAISPLTIQAFNKDTFTVRSIEKTS